MLTQIGARWQSYGQEIQCLTSKTGLMMHSHSYGIVYRLIDYQKESIVLTANRRCKAYNVSLWLSCIQGSGSEDLDSRLLGSITLERSIDFLWHFKEHHSQNSNAFVFALKDFLQICTQFAFNRLFAIHLRYTHMRFSAIRSWTSSNEEILAKWSMSRCHRNQRVVILEWFLIWN